MDLSPPIPFRIEWADSQGKVTASWLAAHFSFRRSGPIVQLLSLAVDDREYDLKRLSGSAAAGVCA